MLSGKVVIIHLIAGLIKKILLFKLSYFPKPYTHSKNKSWIRFVSLCNKIWFATSIDSSKFAEEVDLACLKLAVDELIIEKSKTFSLI